MTNVLLVEDNEKYQRFALEGIAQASKLTLPIDIDLTSGKVLLNVGSFKIQIVSCMRDAALYIRDNSKERLITVLDGFFPIHNDFNEPREMYRDVLRELKFERDPEDNFLKPYSGENHINLDMISEFGCNDRILYPGVKSQEAVKIGFESYLRKYS